MVRSQGELRKVWPRAGVANSIPPPCREKRTTRPRLQTLRRGGEGLAGDRMAASPGDMWEGAGKMEVQGGQHREQHQQRDQRRTQTPNGGTLCQGLGDWPLGGGVGLETQEQGHRLKAPAPVTISSPCSQTSTPTPSKMQFP